jgi:hypothetical protein
MTKAIWMPLPGARFWPFSVRVRSLCACELAHDYVKKARLDVALKESWGILCTLDIAVA